MKFQDKEYLYIDLNSIDEYNFNYISLLLNDAIFLKIKNVIINDVAQFIKVLEFNQEFLEKSFHWTQSINFLDKEKNCFNNVILELYDKIKNNNIIVTDNNEMQKSTSALITLSQSFNDNLLQENKINKNNKIIIGLLCFIIPIVGPIIFLVSNKPTDKLIKLLCYLSIFGLNWLFLFFLLGFYKKDFN